MYRILCPFHKEDSPSCVVYDDGYHCFGCGARGPLSKLGIAPPKRQAPEDLSKSIEYIKSLTTARIRGLELPIDGDSYYVVWPGQDYYKRRVVTGGDAKYIGARGHSKPLFWAVWGRSETLTIVEGELNALSLTTNYIRSDICSPGGASEFASKKYLTQYGDYDKYIIVADADTAGLEGAVKLKAEMVKRTPLVEIHLLERDFNDMLQDGTLEEEVRKLYRLSPKSMRL